MRVTREQVRDASGGSQWRYLDGRHAALCVTIDPNGRPRALHQGPVRQGFALPEARRAALGIVLSGLFAAEASGTFQASTWRAVGDEAIKARFAQDQLWVQAPAPLCLRPDLPDALLVASISCWRALADEAGICQLPPLPAPVAGSSLEQALWAPRRS